VLTRQNKRSPSIKRQEQELPAPRKRLEPTKHEKREAQALLRAACWKWRQANLDEQWRYC